MGRWLKITGDRIDLQCHRPMSTFGSSESPWPDCNVQLTIHLKDGSGKAYTGNYFDGTAVEKPFGWRQGGGELEIAIWPSHLKFIGATKAQNGIWRIECVAIGNGEDPSPLSGAERYLKFPPNRKRLREDGKD